MGTNSPDFLVGRKKGTVFSANGHWRVADDGTAAVQLEFNIGDGRVYTVLEVLRTGNELSLAGWLDEPGGHPIEFHRRAIQK